MGKQPETLFAERVDKDLKKAFGHNVWIENIQQVAKRGTPDRLLCINGHFVGLELKVEGGVVAPLQILKLLEIKKAGGGAYIAYPYTWEVVLHELKEAYGTVKYKT